MKVFLTQQYIGSTIILWQTISLVLVIINESQTNESIDFVIILTDMKKNETYSLHAINFSYYIHTVISP